MKLFTLIIFTATLTSCNFKSSDDYLSDAYKLEQQEKYNDAIILLNKAIEKDPKNIKLLINRGHDKFMLADYKGAIEDNSFVLEKDSHSGLAFLNRGKSKERLKDYSGAIDDFNKAISTKGGELIYLDKVENSLIETGFEYDVKMEEIKLERGITYYYIDSLRKAFEDLNFSIQKNFALSDSYYFRGIIYLRYDMKKEGCEDLNKAKVLGDPDAQDLIDKHCRENYR